MPMSHSTTVFDVKNFNIYPLLTDGTGASPTYGAVVNVPGIADVQLDPDLVTAVLKGDQRVMARRGRIDGFKVQATYGKLALDALVVLQGGTVLGDPPVYHLSAPASLPFFRANFQITELDVGINSVTVDLWKCQLMTAGLLAQKTDNFGQPKFELEAWQSDFVAQDLITVTFA